MAKIQVLILSASFAVLELKKWEVFLYIRMNFHRLKISFKPIEMTFRQVLFASH